MRKFSNFPAACVAMFVFVLSPVTHAVVIDLDATVIGDFKLFGTKVDVNLNAGTFLVTPISSTFESWLAWSTVFGCDVNGANCAQGWSNIYIVETLGTMDVPMTLISSVDGPYDTSARAFANAQSFQFSLSSTQDVSFYFSDNLLSDNTGGMSLEIAAVPIPAAIWLFGSGLLGVIGMTRYRKA